MTEKVDLSKHKTCIFGIQGSGKTYWAKKKYKDFKSPIIFAVNTDDGWEQEKGLYVFKADRTKLQEEFKVFIDFVYKKALEGKIDLIIIDEADLFIQNNWDLDPKLQDLILNHRHIGKGVALWFITRRPQDIPTKIVESSKCLIVFKLEGFNAIQRFKEIHPKIPDLISELDYEKHDFVFKIIGEEPKIHEALK